MSKKLLIDHFGTIKPTLFESASGQWVMRGEFGRADVPTENKRIYPRKLWEREIRGMQNQIQEGKVLGELDHPSDGKTSLKRVSHVVTKLEMQDDGRILGEAVILQNEHGRQLKSILDGGGAVGVSSRGMGSTSMNEDGFEIVQEDYAYITHDAVADPAVRTSYPKFQFEPKEKDTMENKEVKSNVVVEDQTKQENAKKELEAQLRKELTESIQKEFDQKLAAETEQLKKSFENDPKAMAGKLVIEDVAKTLRPFLLPEDVQELVKQQEHLVEEQKKLVEAKDQELKKLSEDLASIDGKWKAKYEKLAKTAHSLGMHLHFYQSVKGQSLAIQESIKKIIGSPSRFDTHQNLIEAIDGAKKALDEIKNSKEGQRKLEQIKESYEKQLKLEKAEKEKAQKELDEAKKLSKESLDFARQQAILAYIIKESSHLPQRNKIAEEARSLKFGDKKQADQFLSKFKSVDTKTSQEYNSIRKRFERVEKQHSTLVEDQLRESGIGKQPRKELVEGADAEINDLFPGTLEQVKALM